MIHPTFNLTSVVCGLYRSLQPCLAARVPVLYLRAKGFGFWGWIRSSTCANFVTLTAALATQAVWTFPVFKKIVISDSILTQEADRWTAHSVGLLEKYKTKQPK